MAKKTTTQADAPATAIDPEAQYRIKVKRPATAGSMRLKPRNSYTVKGKLIAGLGDAVEVIEKV